MSTSFSSSELIYLFLDGEHSGVERSLLFKAMADDQDLQHEFEDALKIRNAAVHETASIVPSAALGQALMSRAGFSTLATATAAAGATLHSNSGSSPWFSGLFSHWSNVALLCLLPILGAAGGFYSAYQGATPSSPAQTYSGSQNVYEARQFGPENGSSIDNAQASSQQLNNRESELLSRFQEQQSTLALVQSRLQQTQQVINNLVHQQGLKQDLQGSLRSSQNNSAELHQAAPVLRTQDNTRSNGGSSVLNTDNRTASSMSIPSVSQVMLASNSAISQSMNGSNASSKANIAVDHYSLPHMTLSLGTEAATAAAIQPSKWTAELRGVQSIQQTMDSVIDPAQARNVANLSASLSYQFSENLGFFLSGGRENFATLVYNNTPGFGEPVVQQMMWWSTIGARLRSDEILSDLPIRAFLQVGVGAADVGAMVRLFPGVEWQPDSRVSFVAGLEQSFLRTSGSNASWPQKTSFSYGFRLNF